MSNGKKEYQKHYSLRAVRSRLVKCQKARNSAEWHYFNEHPPKGLKKCLVCSELHQEEFFIGDFCSKSCKKSFDRAEKNVQKGSQKGSQK